MSSSNLDHEAVILEREGKVSLHSLSNNITLNSESITGDDYMYDCPPVRWKIDLVLMPLLGFCYMLQFLDKLSLNYASLLGILEDVSLTGNQYSWASSVFYFGYLVWSYPTSYLVVRLPIGKYLSASV